MSLRLHNTLSGQIEEFKPLVDNEVRIYTCGPTVYDYAHIGNYRTFVFQDILRRYLKYLGFQVKQVMNLTDVDDKTIRNSQAAGIGLRDYTQKFIDAFAVDREVLNLETPELLVRATDYIEDMVKLVGILEQKGFAYRSEGSIYFRVAAFRDYGKLSKINLSGNRAGARVDADEYEKDDARDFVLWKAAKPGEPSWQTPFGSGRPGWHLECSTMAMKLLGESFDIHSGGSDLIFPHHENEIAQSEAATGKPFARFWLHAEHLIVNGEKMSKSAGNFYTLRDLIVQGHRPSAVRYLLASAPFHKPLNFTFEGLHQAQKSIERLRNFRYRLTMERFRTGKNPAMAERAGRARREFEEALDNNLNTAEALAAIFDLVTDGNTAMDSGEFREDDRHGLLDVLDRWDRMFAVLEDNDYARLRHHGLIKAKPDGAADATVAGLKDGEKGYIDPEGLTDAEIERQIALRNTARRTGRFGDSDRIRENLLKAGVILEDTKAGTRWKRK
ncbi:MAG TPA: cysteine--tRNA ligase [Terriglobia bacterium]|nr:cysteine--tRNA ligase [Terriglobia bacterium]